MMLLRHFTSLIVGMGFVTIFCGFTTEPPAVEVFNFASNSSPKPNDEAILGIYTYRHKASSTSTIMSPHVLSVDGRTSDLSGNKLYKIPFNIFGKENKVPKGDYDIRLSPGPHNFEIGFEAGVSSLFGAANFKMKPQSNRSITFNFQPGKTYVLLIMYTGCDRPSPEGCGSWAPTFREKPAGATAPQHRNINDM